MSKNEFICDCNIIHQEVVDDTLKKMPEDDKFNKLNKSIENGDDYKITYKLSVELDELIAKYYRSIKKDKKKLVTEMAWNLK